MSLLAPRITTALGRGLLVVAVATAGCSTEPTTRLHSLVAPSPATPAGVAAQVAPTLAWELVGVSVPAQVDTPQLVLRLPDDTFALLEHDRWVAPLAEEIRAALGQRLAQLSIRPTVQATWQITVDLRRFDARLGARVTLEADWSIRQASAQAPGLRCHGVFEHPLTSSVREVAAGHRVAVARLGDAVAVGLAALATGSPADCTAAGRP